MLLIAAQLFLLLAVSAGWAWLIALALRRKQGLSIAGSIIYLAAGFIVQILLLLNLAYVDIPVRKSFYVALIPGLCGLWLLWKNYARVFPARKLRRDFRALAIALALAIGIQGFALFYNGPSNYFGSGYIDQINYVFQAQFLLERPFSTPYVPESVTFEPWLLKGLQMKDQRLGESIAHAYVAALTGGDAQEAYGATTLYFLALLAAAAYALCRASAIRPWLAALGASWTTLCPATSEIHVYGFLSQTSTLFVFPAVFVLTRMPLNLQESVVLPALFLSFLGVSYTEFLPFGVMSYALLALANGKRRFLPSAGAAVLAIVLALILVPAFLPRGAQFIQGQAQFALSRNPALEEWSPHAGTFFGWASTVAGYSNAISGPGRAFVVLTGGFLVALIILSVRTNSSRTAMRLAALAAGPVLVGGWMLMQPAFTKYAFYKLTNNFAYLYIFLAILGAARLIRLFERHRWKLGIAAVALFICLGFSMGLAGTIGFQRRILSRDSPYTTLTKLRTPEIQQSISYIRRNPDRTFVIKEKNSAVAGWLAYHARDSKTYADVDVLADIVLVPRGHWLPSVPYEAQNLSYVGSDGIRNETASSQLPIVEIENPQGEEHDANLTWYWVGKSLTIKLLHWDMREPRISYLLVFRATTGPAHPSTARKLLISKADNSFQMYLSYTGVQNLSACLPLVPGPNQFTLSVVEPAEPVFVGGPDPRILMARIDSVGLRRSNGAADCDQISKVSAAAIASPRENTLQKANNQE